MKWDKFAVKIKCKMCGKGNGILELSDDGGCSDPECCGGTSYNITIKCDKCDEEETN